MNRDAEIMEEAKHCLQFGKLVDHFVARHLVGRIERQETELRSLQDDVNHLNSLLRRTTGMGQGEIDAAAELEAKVEKLEEQSKIDSLLVGKCQAEILRLQDEIARHAADEHTEDERAEMLWKARAESAEARLAENDLEWFQIIESILGFHPVNQTEALKKGIEKVKSLKAEILRLRLYEKRMRWLHDCSTGCTDADGFEWGIYRTRWVNGQPAEVRQTLSDFSDLDAEMARASPAADS